MFWYFLTHSHALSTNQLTKQRLSWLSNGREGFLKKEAIKKRANLVQHLLWHISASQGGVSGDDVTGSEPKV